MSLPRLVELALLREWGFLLWDPLCVSRDLTREGVYDSYLLQAMGRLRAGEDEAQVAADLARTEFALRGVARSGGAHWRARLLVRRMAQYRDEISRQAVRVQAEAI